MERRRWTPVAVLVVLLLVVAGCGNAKETTGSSTTSPDSAVPTNGGEANRSKHEPINGVPGVTDDSIAFAVVGTKTNNPLGTCLLDCYNAGIKAYFDYRNSQGGIYGRDLVISQSIDDELAKNQQVDLGIISDKKAFGSFQAGLLQQGWGDLDDAGMPTYTWGINGPAAANRPAIFPSAAIRCPDCTRRAIPYAAQATGKKKVGVLGYSTSQNSKACADADAESVKRYADDTGVTLGYLKDNLPYGLPNGVGPEVTAMKKAGVDFIATCFDLNAMKTVAQELKRQHMSDVVLYHPNSYDQTFIHDAGTLFDGDVVEVQFRPFESEAQDSALDTYKTWMAKAHQPLTELSMVGWINATLAYDGLLAAGPQFNRAKVVAATNAITDFTADGLLSTIDWTNAHKPYTQATRAGAHDSDCVALVKVVNSEFEVMGNKAKPWMCWDKEDLSWSEPVPTDFT